MILSADIGNSTIYLGIVRDGIVIDACKIPTHAESHLEWIQQFVADRNIEGSIVSSVVPACTDEVCSVIEKICRHKPLVLKKDVSIPFPVALDSPEELGADRIADAVAAIHDYPLPLIIIDFGTATTCSVINKDGVFLGGSIGPGVNTSFEALTSKAAQLKDMVLGVPQKTIGSNTKDCINSGIVIGHAAMADGMIDRIERETQTKYHVVMTGGMAKTIAPLCTHTLSVDTELILRGIFYLYQSVG